MNLYTTLCRTPTCEVLIPVATCPVNVLKCPSSSHAFLLTHSNPSCCQPSQLPFEISVTGPGRISVTGPDTK